jgi:hypothetical protein
MALRDGILRSVGILIDVALFVPMIAFAVWYQKRRRQFPLKPDA